MGDPIGKTILQDEQSLIDMTIFPITMSHLLLILSPNPKIANNLGWGRLKGLSSCTQFLDPLLSLSLALSKTLETQKKWVSSKIISRKRAEVLKEILLHQR